ncbi:MAG TPA: hypothetical protein ENN43_08710 [bacterium]|nr:hypothetical protein [bacterium]
MDRITEIAEKVVKMYLKEPVAVIVGALVALVLTVVTFGLLAPVMFLGLAEFFRKIEKGEKPVINDLFIHLNKFIFLAVIGLISGATIFLGMVLLIIPAFLAAALWIYAPFYHAYEGKGIIDSLKMSAKTAISKNYLGHVVLILALGLVNAVGSALWIGTLFTFPVTAGFVYYLYMQNRIAE